MTPIRRRFVDTDYGQLHLRMSGLKNHVKQPLVCLHMSPQSGASFSKFMSNSELDRTVLAPDYHGFGESDCPPEHPKVRIEDYARTIWQALDALQIDKVDLLGHHTGSKVAVEMTNQHPERVGSIVMISASVLSEDDFNAVKETKKFDPIPLDEEATRLTSLWKGFRQFCAPDLPVETVFKYVVDALRPGEAYLWGNRAAFLYNENFTNVLSRLPHPVTVINPNDDLYSITPNIMPFLQNGHLMDKPNWEHGSLDLCSDDVVKTVLKALKNNKNRSVEKRFAS